QEQVLAYSNREADRLNRVIRGLPLQKFGPLDRRWILSPNGDIYHYDFFDTRANEFTRLATYRLQPSGWGLASLTSAERVRLVRQGDPDGALEATWKATNGWTRDFSEMAAPGREKRTVVNYMPFAERDLPLEPPAYFKAEEPDAALMTFRQLQQYI